MQSLPLAQRPTAVQTDGSIDKGLLALKGRPLVAWQRACLKPWVSEIIINANQNHDHYTAFGRVVQDDADLPADRKSTRLNSSHVATSYAVFCLKKKKQQPTNLH